MEFLGGSNDNWCTKQATVFDIIYPIDTWDDIWASVGEFDDDGNSTEEAAGFVDIVDSCTKFPMFSVELGDVEVP